MQGIRGQAASHAPDTHLFVSLYLKEHNLSEIDEISNGYGRALQSSGTDGIRKMALHFADSLAEGKLQPETVEQLYVEFYGILLIFFDDFKRFKLLPLG